MAATAAAKNRKIRQEELRNQLSNQKLVEKVLDISNKLSEPGLESVDIQRLKAAADINLKLINKYLPDLKSIEHTGDEDNPVGVSGKWTVEFVNAAPESKS